MRGENLASLSIGRTIFLRPAIDGGTREVRQVTYTSSMPAGRKTAITPVGVVGKILRTLELLDRSPAGLQLKDIARLTGLNKSTAHRFLKHLEGEGYLFRDDSAAYMPPCSGTALEHDGGDGKPRNPNGKIAGGISISGPAARINKTNLASIAQTVKLAAHDIFTRLGFPKDG